MNKITFFPNCYEGEDFRSIIFRYHIRTGNTIEQTGKELFGINSYRFPLIPRNLSYFINRLPDEYLYDTSYFLNKHTYFPFFKCFLKYDTHRSYLEDIEFGIYKGTKQAGQIAVVKKNPFLSKKIRYCSICLNENYEQLGECYIHLKHQIMFLKFCPEHFVKLIDSCPTCGEEFVNEKICRIPQCSKGHSLLHNFRYLKDDTMLELFKDIQYFQCHSYFDGSYILNKLIVALGNNDYISHKGVYSKKLLIYDLFNYYSKELMSKLGYEIERMTTRGKIERIVTLEHMGNDPMFYLLLIKFLFGSVKELIDYKQPYSVPLPFGHGPWECKNKLCTKYNNSIITRCRTTPIPGQRKFKGVFQCPLCFFEYSIVSNDSYKKEYFIVEHHGALWIRQLVTMFLEGKSVSYIRKKIGSHDPKIREYLRNEIMKIYSIEVDWKKINNFNEIPEEARNIIKANFLSYSEVGVTTENKNIEHNFYCRAFVEGAIKDKPDITRSELNIKSSHIMAWLRKNDKEWLSGALPPLKRANKLSDENIKKLDNDLSKKVRSAASELRLSNLYIIGKNTILNYLSQKDKNLILAHSEKLKLTMAEINNGIESEEDFLIRNLKIVFNKAKQRGYKKVSFKSLEAVSKRYKYCNDAVKIKIEEELRKYNKQY